MNARKAILLSTSTNIGISILGAVTGVLTARALGPEERGYLSAVMAWFAISLVVSELGQSAAVTYFVAKHPKRSSAYISSARKIMLVGSTVVAGTGIIFADFLAGGDSAVGLAYRIVFFGTIINALGAPAVYALQSLSFKRWNVVRLAPTVFYVIGLIGLYILDSLTLVLAALTTMLSFVGQLLIALLFIRTCSPGLIKPTSRDFVDLRKYGVAQAASGVPSTLSENYDRVVLSWSVDAYQLGQYAVALTVSQASRSIGTAIASVVFPLSAKLGNAESSRMSLEKRSLWATAVTTGIALLTVGWVSQPLVPILFGENFNDALPIIWLLVPVIWLRGINALVAVFLRGRNRPYYATAGQLLALLVGASTLIYTTPLLGLVAAPISFAIGETIGFFINLLFLKFARSSTN